MTMPTPIPAATKPSNAAGAPPNSAWASPKPIAGHPSRLISRSSVRKGPLHRTRIAARPGAATPTTAFRMGNARRCAALRETTQVVTNCRWTQSRHRTLRCGSSSTEPIRKPAVPPSSGTVRHHFGIGHPQMRAKAFTARRRIGTDDRKRRRPRGGGRTQPQGQGGRQHRRGNRPTELHLPPYKNRAALEHRSCGPIASSHCARSWQHGGPTRLGVRPDVTGDTAHSPRITAHARGTVVRARIRMPSATNRTPAAPPAPPATREAGIDRSIPPAARSRKPRARSGRQPDGFPSRSASFRAQCNR